jgi:abortive infection bacteriophage resistance protein
MEQILYTKPFLSYRAQIELLKSRGMKFADEAKTLHLLSCISYYRFSAYWHPMLIDKQKPAFKPDTNFEAVFSLYKFDRELRRLLLSELEKIEVAVRTQMTYWLSTQYGSFWMDNEALFADLAKHRATLAKINSELQRSDEEFILTFKTQYSNPLSPSFITLEITSFGALSRLYENLKKGEVRRDIAASFGLTDKTFGSWLHSFVYIRNICAHHARIWNRHLQIQPLFPRHTQNAWISTAGLSNRRMYYILSMIVYVLNIINPNHTFRQRLNNLLAKYPNVDARAMGFPAAWQAEPLWVA